MPWILSRFPPFTLRFIDLSCVTSDYFIIHFLPHGRTPTTVNHLLPALSPPALNFNDSLSSLERAVCDTAATTERHYVTATSHLPHTGPSPDLDGLAKYFATTSCDSDKPDFQSQTLSTSALWRQQLLGYRFDIAEAFAPPTCRAYFVCPGVANST